MEVYLIRHLKTKGNMEGRYIGSTDESLICTLVDAEKLRMQTVTAGSDMVDRASHGCTAGAETVKCQAAMKDGACLAVRDGDGSLCGGCTSCGDYAAERERLAACAKESFDIVKRSRETLPDMEVLVVSPMKRCRETAELLFPGMRQEVCEDLREMHFGLFENHNHEELKDIPEYRQWIESRGKDGFPGGEAQEEFMGRCKSSFCGYVEQFQKEGKENVAFVVHGGVIMLLMAVFSKEEKDLYDWQVENGSGYKVRIDEAKWKEGDFIFEKNELL